MSAKRRDLVSGILALHCIAPYLDRASKILHTAHHVSKVITWERAGSDTMAGLCILVVLEDAQAT